MNSNSQLTMSANMRPHLMHVLRGEYDLPGMEAEIDTILDIGANQGAFTKWVRHRWPGSRVIAYEPVPKNIEYFRANHSAEIGSQIELVEAAVVGCDIERDTVLMLPGPNNDGEATVTDWITEGTDDRFKLIPVRCIHAATLPKADMVKLDIEGEEIHILEDVLTRCQPCAVAYEWHGEPHRRDCEAIMRAAGFELVTDDRPREGRGVQTWYHRGDERITQEPIEGHRRLHIVPPAIERVFLPIPVHYSPTARFAVGIEDLIRSGHDIAIWWTIGDSLVTRARDHCVAEFIHHRPEREWLLFIDADIVFKTSDIELLFQNASSHDIICGFYAKKRADKTEWVGNPLDGGEEKPNKLIAMKEAGTGFMLIHRRVIEAMIIEYPELEYTTDGKEDRETRWHLFESGLVYDEDEGRRRLLSEDWMFCYKARKLGFRIWGDPRIMLGHEGTAIFPIQR